MQKEVLNKSRTYILPLIAARNSINIKYVRNTYLYTSEDFENFKLHLIHEFTDLEEIAEYDKKLMQNPSYIRKLRVDDDDKIKFIYTFKLDKDFRDTFRNFMYGKYSKISNVDKNIIKSFWTDVYGIAGRKFVSKVKDILDRSSILKKELEEQLAVKLSDEAELSSIIDLEDEIYYGN